MTYYYDMLSQDLSVMLKSDAETDRRLQIKARVLKEKGCLYDFFRYLKHWWRWIFAGLGNRLSYPGGFHRLTKRILHNLTRLSDRTPSPRTR